MRKNIVLLTFITITLAAGCTSNTQPQIKSDNCVIKMDTPEGNLPEKIEQTSGNSPKYKAIEKAI